MKIDAILIHIRVVSIEVLFAQLMLHISGNSIQDQILGISMLICRNLYCNNFTFFIFTENVISDQENLYNFCKHDADCQMSSLDPPLLHWQWQ